MRMKIIIWIFMFFILTMVYSNEPKDNLTPEQRDEVYSLIEKKLIEAEKNVSVSVFGYGGSEKGVKELNDPIVRENVKKILYNKSVSLYLPNESNPNKRLRKVNNFMKNIRDLARTCINEYYANKEKDKTQKINAVYKIFDDFMAASDQQGEIEKIRKYNAAYKKDPRTYPFITNFSIWKIKTILHFDKISQNTIYTERGDAINKTRTIFKSKKTYEVMKKILKINFDEIELNHHLWEISTFGYVDKKTKNRLVLYIKIIYGENDKKEEIFVYSDELYTKI